MKKLILIVFYMANLSIAYSSTIVAIHPNVDAITERALIVSHKDYITFETYQLRKTVSSDLKENLAQTFITAQKAFLSAEISDIELLWRNVVAYSYKADWDEPQRRMIQIAYLRLAQLSLNENKTNDWIQQAWAYDSNYNLDEKVFPPPIVSQYNFLKSRNGLHQINTSNFVGFTKMRVNGVEYPITGKPIRLSPGAKRISLFSNKYAFVSKVISTEDMNTFVPPRLPLLQGTCDSPQIQSSLQSAESQHTVVAYYPGGCRRNLNSTESLKSLLPAPYTAETIQSPFSKPAPESKKFYEKPKFWLTSAAITGVIILVKKMQEHESQSPTQREGF